MQHRSRGSSVQQKANKAFVAKIRKIRSLTSFNSAFFDHLTSARPVIMKSVVSRLLDSV